jgi:hypothetical protein
MHLPLDCIYSIALVAPLLLWRKMRRISQAWCREAEKAAQLRSITVVADYIGDFRPWIHTLHLKGPNEDDYDDDEYYPGDLDIIEEETIKYIAVCRNLSRLIIDNGTADPKGLKMLFNTIPLTLFKFNGDFYDTSDGCILANYHSTSLITLSIVTQVKLDIDVSGFPNLENLVIRSWGLTAAGTRNIANLRRLTNLCVNVYDREILLELARGCPALKILSLYATYLHDSSAIIDMLQLASFKLDVLILISVQHWSTQFNQMDSIKKLVGSIVFL